MTKVIKVRGEWIEGYKDFIYSAFTCSRCGEKHEPPTEVWNFSNHHLSVLHQFCTKCIKED